MKKAKLNNVVALSVLLFTLYSELSAQNSSVDSKLLNEKQQAIVYISSTTATGDLQNLKNALSEGLDVGLTVNQTKEVIVHLYAYVGFPRSITGLNTLMEVLEVRRARDINDEIGVEASPINDERNKYDRGVETLYELTGRNWGKPESGYGAFAPAIDRFLKEHLFADLFERDVLTYQERELVTISALSSIRGVEPMLQSHIRIGLSLGFTESQMEQVHAIIEEKTNLQINTEKQP